MAIGNLLAFQEHTLRTALQQFNYLAGTMTAALMKSSYVPDQAANKEWSDISAHEVDSASFADYSQQVLAGKTLAKAVGGETAYNFDPIDFGANVTITAKWLVLFLDTGGVGSYLWGYADLNDGGGDLVVTSGPLIITPDSGGAYLLDPNV